VRLSVKNFNNTSNGGQELSKKIHNLTNDEELGCQEIKSKFKE